MKRVAVAMSGGGDSSVCAALLKDLGFEVFGITMQILPRADSNACCGIGGITDARRVCSKLGIPHYVLNLRKQFEQKVISDFCAEYKKGRTPNPCIRCNQYTKFDTLLKKVRQLGAEYLATGHYARIEFDQKKKKFLLKKAIDPKKDQSYALYTLSQAQLQRILMPVGEFSKQEIRRIAKMKHLSVADKADSQEICFIPDNDYAKFVQKFMPGTAHPGPIIKKSKVIGRHRGIIHYTVGQRKGIGIADKESLYVISINRAKNSIVVGSNKEALSRELLVNKVRWVSIKKPARPIKAQVKVRYLHPQAKATIIPQRQGRLKIKFEQAQFAVTPGQAAVFYNGETLLGGGTILSAQSPNSKKLT